MNRCDPSSASLNHRRSAITNIGPSRGLADAAVAHVAVRVREWPRLSTGLRASPCPGLQSYLQLLTNFLVNVSTDGGSNFKCCCQAVANRCRQAACVDATIDVDFQRIARCERDGPLTFENLVLNRTVAGHAAFSFQALDSQWLTRRLER